MTEEGKIARAMGRRTAIRVAVSLFGAVAPVLVLGWLCGTSALAGLIHEDLVGVVFWSQFMCFPFAAVAFGIGLGLLLRRINLAPYRQALDPLGPSSRYLLSGVKWKVRGGRHPAELRLARRSFVVVVEGDPTVDIRGGRENSLARLARGDRWVTEQLGEGVFVASKDEAGLQAHLARPGVREAWCRLLTNDRRSLRAVHLDPGTGGTLQFRHVPEHQLSEANARQWVEDLGLLLDGGQG